MMRTASRPPAAALFSPHLRPGGMEKFAVLMAQTLKEDGFRVEIFTDGPARARVLDRSFGSSLDGIPIRDIGARFGSVERFVAATADYDLFVNNSPIHSFPSFARASWLWVHYLPRWVPPHLGFYRVLANSKHTQSWVRRLWKTPAEVLYGPVDVERLRPLPKEKIILSAARLHSRPVPKRELEMVRLFAALHRQGGLAGWSYHIAGILEPSDRAWLGRLRAAAAGAPVRIHLDLPFKELAGLYGRASLFWHGCGAMEDARRHPERLEHFGIAIVEAMAAGCLPIAPANGGPAELVRHGETGFLYHSWDEMGRQTLAAARPGAALRALRARARTAASRFSRRRFRDGLRKRLGRPG